MSEWQPIETAPRSTERVLIYLPHGGECLIAWREGDDYCDAQGALSSPTHWMPLPDPPSDTKGE